MDTNGFTPTQRRMLEVLADGLPHRREELRACLEDELASIETMRKHIGAMRKLLRTDGHDIVCISGGRQRAGQYQHVVLLTRAIPV